MNIKSHIKSLPFLFAASSLVLLAIVSLTTNPLTNVGYVIFFLVILGIFLISSGYILAGFYSSRLSRKGNYRIVLVVCSVIIATMLRSIGSLGGVELLLLFGLTLIAFFYIGRNSK